MRTSLPLRLSVPLALALLGVALTLIQAVHDHIVSYRSVEQRLLGNARSLSHIVVPSLERAVIEGDKPGAEDQVLRLALMPSLSLALVYDASNRLMYATDFRFRNQNLNQNPAAALITRARATLTEQSDVTADGSSVRVAFPFSMPPLPGELRSSRTAVLYTETDLRARKREESADIRQRALIMGGIAGLACFLVWLYLRVTFTRHLDEVVAGIAAYVPGESQLRVPAEGQHDLAQISRVLNQMFTDLSVKQAALRDSEARIRILGDNLPNGMIYQLEMGTEGQERRFTYVSAGVEKLHEVTAQEVLSGAQVLYSQIVEGDRAALAAREAEALASMKPFLAEARVQAPSGTVRWVLLAATPRRAANGRILWDGIELDITERKLAERQIHSLNTELEQRVHQRTVELAAANQELEAFSYSVSHDLRAPLRHVMGYVDLLRKHLGEALDASGARYMRTIADSALRMGALIDDLLAFSRLGRQAMRRDNVNLAELVREVVEGLRVDTEARRINWTIGELPVVDGDRAMLRQVLANLLGNAVKYTRGREPAAIEIGVRSRPGEFVLFVRDNGAGFDMRYVDKLFGVFQRLHSETEFEGTGIGLALVRRIIGRHGGRTWAEGKVGEGATIWFALPASQSQPRQAMGNHHQAAPTANEPSLPNCLREPSTSEPTETTM